jgi:uncharacterized protein (DUF488 family)
MKIFTIGHSTRKLNDFIAILIQNGIKCLVDVRSYPGSEYVPQFNAAKLKKSLARFDIKYYHLPKLGGRRHLPNIHHPALTSKSFSAYAEYMMTSEFHHGMKLLKRIARKCRTIIMCSEAVYWRCHRRMISDRLTFDGWSVYHLGVTKTPIKHKIWDVAILNKDNEIIYDKIKKN